ncbi:MAG: SpoIIE family protein phosphatase [Candidatus Riflebacteria bacterium]|nr:SpoIIE family protein phosphatase [Candidatus Riflebacteria bacterium]
MRWIKWLAFCLGFGFLPIFLISWGIEQNWQRTSKSEAQKLSEIVVRQLENIRKAGSDERFFLRMIQSFGKTFDNAKSKIPEFLKQIEKQYPGLFEFYFTDHEGNLIEELSHKVPSKFVIKKLHPVLSTFRNGPDYKMSSGQRKVLEAFIGETITLEDLNDALREKSRLHSVSSGLRHNYFFSQSYTNFFMMVHVNVGAVQPVFCIKRLLGRLNKPFSQIDFGVHIYGESFSKRIGNHDEEAFLKKCLYNYERSTRDVFITEKYIVAILLGEGKQRIWAFQRIPDVLNPMRFKTIERFLLAIAFIFLCTISFRYIVPEKTPWLSIRQKLLILLSFAAGLPLLILMVVGQEYLWEKDRSLREETFSKMENNLRGIDNKFMLYLRNLSEIVNRIVKNSGNPDGTFNRESFSQIYGYYDKKYQIPTPMILSRDGTLIHSRVAEKEKILQQLGEKMLEKYNLSRGISDTVPKKEKVRMDDLFSKDKSLNDLYTYMLKRLGSIEKMNFFGKMDRLLLLNVISGADNGANFMFFFFWTPQKAAFDYIKKVSTGGNLFSVFPNDSYFCFPASCEVRPWVNDFTKRVQIRDKFTSEQLPVNGIDYLVAGIPAKELAKYILIQKIPASKIVGIIRKLRNNLILLGVFCLLFSLMSGGVIARQFLTPIQHLASGVAAVDKRNFEHRVPPLDNDELGKLSRTFNLMIVGLEEMSVAQNVQTNLFPSGILETPKWKVFGHSKSASEIGGDYLDYFSLSDGRVLVVVGDVSGHGVPAALIMAMAKATVNNEILHNPAPSVVLQRLSELIFKTMHRKRFMTFFYLLTNAETGEITFSNAGHCQPVLLRKDGTWQEIGVAGFPLGVRKARAYKEENVTLEKGDRLYLFTDGFPETLSPSKDVLGYPELINWLTQTSNMGIEESCNCLFRKIGDFRGSFPQDDDNTMIVVEYSGE